MLNTEKVAYKVLSRGLEHNHKMNHFTTHPSGGEIYNCVNCSYVMMKVSNG